MEFRAGVAKAFLTSAELLEVVDSLWHDVLEELEVDAAGTFCDMSASPVLYDSISSDGGEVCQHLSTYG